MKYLPTMNKKRTLAILMVAALASSLLGRYVADVLRMPAHYILAPLGDLGTSAAAGFKSRLADRTAGPISEQDARRLRRELQDLHHKVIALARFGYYWKKECRRIQNLRKPYGPIPETCELIPARVVLGEALPYGRSKTVNVGTVRGAAEGMHVVEVMTDRSKALPEGLPTITVSGSTLVGRIEVAGKLIARIQLVTDRGFRMRANIWRTIDPENPRRITVTTKDGAREQVLTRRDDPIEVEARGNGDNELKVVDVPRNHKVRRGDQLWTRPSNRILPVQLIVGKVVRVEESQKNPIFVDVYVKPAADLAALRDVYIVRPLASTLPARPGGRR